MKAIAALLLLLCCPFLGIANTPASVCDAPTMEQARRFITRERWKDAVKAYRAIVEEDKANGVAWYLLGYSLANNGDHAGSIQANLQALEHGGPLPSIHYNLACDFEQTGDLVLAEEHLLTAIELGYLDYDWIAVDEDLVKTLARGNIPIPEPYDFQTNKGRNGVVIPYELLLPANYDATKQYPCFVLFGAGPGPLASAWTLREFCGSKEAAAECIVLLVVAPERGWYTHPTHHALEDLLKKVLKEYKVAGGKFHLAGLGSGANPASTYASMSKRYFQSFSIIGGQPFRGDDKTDIKRHKRLRFAFLMGSADVQGIAEARRVMDVLGGASESASLRIIEDESILLKSLHKGLWLSPTMMELGLKD